MENESESSWIKFNKSGRGETFGWGLIFLWGAIVLLMEETINVEFVSWWDGWAVFFIGFGTIAMLGAVIGVQIKDYGKAGWNFAVGTVALSFSLGTIYNSDLGWVFAAFAIALGLIIAAVALNGDDRKNLFDWC
jgi:hypothetical protein